MKRPYEETDDSFPPSKRTKFEHNDWQDYYIG